MLELQSLPPRITKGDLLAWIQRTGAIDPQRIGRIELHGNRATVEVPQSWLPRLVRALDGAALKNKVVHARSTARSDDETADDHFGHLAKLLQLENEAEAQRAVERGRRLSAADAERAGNALVSLTVLDEEAGLGGRYLIRLAKRGRLLPWTRLDVGQPVVLSAHENAAGTGWRGVISRRSTDSLQVALAQLPDELNDYDLWRLDAAHDEIAYERQRAGLERARMARGDRLTELRQVLLGQRPARFDDPPAAKADCLEGPTPHTPDATHLSPEADGLNAPQRAAVEFALRARDVALIHGPPGTGKTTTVVELICQAVRRGEKVLACAPSNLAVDNMLERLVRRGERVVRLGHPARVLPELQSYSLDRQVESHRDVALAHKLVKEALALFRKADRHTRARPERGARRDTRQEARSLLADARRLEAQAVEQVLDEAAVVCATTTGLDDSLLGRRRFGLVVVDEACQSTEPGCWVPLARAERVVLAGDHCQLPPTVISPEAAEQGLATSLFERLIALSGGELARRLTVQYRMHREIMDFSSAEFYDGELLADAAVAGHLLADLSHVASAPATLAAAEFIDTAGAGYDEQLEPDGESRLNPREAEVVAEQVQMLLETGVLPSEIAVIAPYAAQARLLRELLPVAGLEVDSVDGFQGREKEAIVISLVRSNATGEIGFLSDVRRTNVALTRARRKLVVVGDSATLATLPFYARLIEYFERIGGYRTVWG
jgi:ATP-dependent RNA/DNA helicase IGHMBP2